VGEVCVGVDALCLQLKVVQTAFDEDGVWPRDDAGAHDVHQTPGLLFEPHDTDGGVHVWQLPLVRAEFVLEEDDAVSGTYGDHLECGSEIFFARRHKHGLRQDFLGPRCAPQYGNDRRAPA
jgi:hypothetical protein